MRANAGHRGRIVAPTFGDAVEACIEGPSGLLAMDPDIRWLPSSPGGAKVVWPNGSEALVFGTPFPRDIDRFKAGGNRHIDWWEEMAANTQLAKAWDQAALGLRLGEHPHSIASTTPRGTGDYRAIRKMPDVVRTHATLFDNPHNPSEWVERMRARYEGTRLGRQELAGELLDDALGALWRRELFDDRADTPPTLVRVVVAIDPAATSGEDADDTGIVIAGLGADGHGYVLADRTCHLPPDQWARRVHAAYEEFSADRVVAEVNNGGEMVGVVLKTTETGMAYKSIHASRGKAIRAEPVAALYEQGKVHHVGAFPHLEDQCCQWVPGEGEDSPDRLDALVWAITDLMLAGGPGQVLVAQGRIPGVKAQRGRW
jgi:phage terminase large subunit-like protein